MAEVNPYEQFLEKPPKEEVNPYEQFLDKPKEPSTGFGDFFKSIPRGILSGVSAAISGSGQAEAPLSMPPEQAAAVPGPNEGTALMEQHVTGPLHKPDTRWGQYGATTGEWLGNPGTYLGPGGFLPKAAAAVTGALGSEAAGQLSEGSRWEPAARVVGGLLGGNVQRVVTPQPGRIPVQRTADEAEKSLTPGAFDRAFKEQWKDTEVGHTIPGMSDAYNPYHDAWDTTHPSMKGLYESAVEKHYVPSTNGSGTITINEFPHPEMLNKDLSSADKVKSWNDFKKLHEDLRAPGGWKQLQGPNYEGELPPGITSTKPTIQMPLKMDKTLTSAGSVLGGGAAGHALGWPFAAEGGALAGYAGSSHSEGLFNPWLRNQLLKNQPPFRTTTLQTAINALKRKGDEDK